jgi:D-alanyl-lipoteichoic acid acyltransferase DltB (MBOAT superfamily)
MKTGKLTADLIGIGLSGLCIIHCVGLVGLAYLLPNALNILGSDPVFHKILFFIILTIASLSFYQGYKKHKSQRPLLIMGLGLLLLIIGTFYVDDHSLQHNPSLISTETWHNLMVTLGSVFMILAHIDNHKKLKNCVCKTH